jgi:DsbC/DsbD-like thiol-disulfide interchange protein
MAAAELSSPWSEGYNSKVRLLAGRTAGSGPDGARLLVGIEIAIAKGWKTYWRTPGDSGGVPPSIDVSASENVAAATVLYPAPERLTDPTGDAIGYKDSVTFPIEIKPTDSKKPVVMTVQIEYGICREICVPAEARMTLTIPAALSTPLPAPLRNALAQVPARADQIRPTDPKLATASAQLTGEKPRLSFQIVYPGGAKGADLFVEAPDGIYLPLPRKTAETGTTLDFEVDLTSGLEAKDLAGKTLLLTAVSDAGRSELTWAVP